jgi:TolB-like protein
MNRPPLAAAALLAGVLGCQLVAPRELYSIAVLPLENASADPAESDYLADGITRSVITRLAQVGVRVTPWASVRRYRDVAEPRDVARELNVDAVLLGTFQLEGDRILTQLTLVDAESGLVAWAEELEEPYEDLFEVQRRIAQGAASSLKRSLTGEEEELLAKNESRSVEAYELYLQGAHLLQEGTREATEVAFHYFSRAAARDDTLAEAQLGLGAVHNVRYFSGWGGASSLAEAARSYETALSLDPTSMVARRGLVMTHFFKGESAAVLEQGAMAARTGRAEDAETLLTRALSYDHSCCAPLSLELYRRAIEIDPGNPEARYRIVSALVWSGEIESAVDAGNDYIRRFGDDSDIHSYLGLARALLGDEGRARDHYLMATKGEPHPWVYLWAGLFFDARGERERAIELWKRGATETESNLALHPDHVSMRAFHAAFRALLSGDGALLGEAEEAYEAAGYRGWEVEILVMTKVRLGDAAGAIELLRENVRNGRVFFIWETVLESVALTLPPSKNLDELRAEHLALKDRYRKVYGIDESS